MTMPIRSLRWETIGASLLVALVVCAYVLAELRAPYISPGTVSLRPWASVFIVGPLTMVFGAWVAVEYCNPLSPVSSYTVPMSRGKQALTELSIFLLPVYVAFILAAFISVPLVSVQATGGSIDWARIVTAFLAFSFFPICGFAIGIVIARLWAIPFAFLFSVIVMYGVPLLMLAVHGIGQPVQPLTTLMLFGTYSTYSEALGDSLPAWWIAYGLWFFVSIALVFFVFTFQRWKAGYGTMHLFTGIVAVMFPVSVLIIWGSHGALMSEEYVASEKTCGATVLGTEVCVAAEEKAQLTDAIAAADSVEKLLGKSEKSFASYFVTGSDNDSTIINFSLPYNDDTTFEIASGLVHLDACQPDGSKELDFSYEVTARASGIKNLNGHRTLTEKTVSGMSDDEFMTMFQNNRDKITKCEMTAEDYLATQK